MNRVTCKLLEMLIEETSLTASRATFSTGNSLAVGRGTGKGSGGIGRGRCSGARVAVNERFPGMRRFDLCLDNIYRAILR